MATEPFLQAEPALADLAKQLEHWRQTHPAALDPIPSPFWEQAVRLGKETDRASVTYTNLLKSDFRCISFQTLKVVQGRLLQPSGDYRW